MNPRDLEYFLQAASHGQVKRAAEHIGITQPALTKSLIRLEENTGTKLFQRTATGIMLTPAGRLLESRAKAILLKIKDARRELRDAAAGRMGHLRVGAGPSITESLLPPVASSVLGDSPGVTLQIITALNDTLFEELRAGKLDLVISGIPESAPDDFEQELLFHDAIVFVASGTHRLARRRGCATPKELLDYPWILPPERALARRWLEQMFIKHGLQPPQSAIEADSSAAIMAIVASSRLIGFQPRYNLKSIAIGRRVREIPVVSGHWRRPVGITVRKNEYLPPVADLFISALRNAVKDRAKS